MPPSFPEVPAIWSAEHSPAESTACLRPFFVHEVVADHVHDNHVGVFDSPHVRMRYLEIELRHAAKLASVAPGQRDGPASYRVAVFHRAQHVRANSPNR